LQGLLTSPRENLTTETIQRLLTDASSIHVDLGCELLDQSLLVIHDISEFVERQGGSVRRQSFANIHAELSITLTEELDWGQAIIRPYMVISADGDSARFNLGAYYTNAPTRDLSRIPITYEVKGVDILHRLATPVGDAHFEATGTGYLAAVEAILIDQGFTSYIIDPQKITSVLPADRIWPMQDQITWLTVVNDLLAAINYQGIWSDWNGALRVQPYIAPVNRASEWTYDTDSIRGNISPDRSVTFDFYEAPNRWVAVRNNNLADETPEEGNGIFTYINDFDGPTSVAARGGRVITKTIQVEAADQASLEEQARVTIAADKDVATTYSLKTVPNPLHWHFDRLTLNDNALTQPVEVLGYAWELPLDGGDMGHTWRNV